MNVFTMNPELYAVLPKNKKVEYKNTFPVTGYIKRHKMTTDGLMWVWLEPANVPDEWLAVSRKLEEVSTIGMLNNPDLYTASLPGKNDVYKRIISHEGIGTIAEVEDIEAYMFIPTCSGISSLYPMEYNNHKTVDVGLTPGEQRLIKKGVVKNGVRSND